MKMLEIHKNHETYARAWELLSDAGKCYDAWLEAVVEEVRTMGLILHGNHSNVKESERLEEWSTCRMTFCKARYDLVYGPPTDNAGTS
jgi:hypothetical protein